MKKTLRLILGDQLNSEHTWYKKIDDSITYAMMEVRSETDYVKHHIQKVVGFFAAMRQFAKALQEDGHRVIYIKINDKNNELSFQKNIETLIQKYAFSHFEYQQPDEYRVNEMMKELCITLPITYAMVDTEHFFTTRNEMADFFKGKKTFLLESFYRHMRKKHSVLMDGDQPYNGQWNYDSDNRKKLPVNHKATPPFIFENDVTDIVNEIEKVNIETIGHINPSNFIWPINREQSLQLLHFFVKECLSLFGTYEDAMSSSEWSLYHSRLSFSMNTKMLSPKEVVDAAIAEWQQRQKEITFNQIEGFVRQILGWREYMRGIYWMQMPSYASLNFFNNQNKLPNWYWTGETKMKCLQHSITQSLNYAYAHHIQRLMVTGNFALLTGVHPDEVDNWYLGIYIDALDWVEITNTRGMSQFADGGIVGSKPYVSSAAYIDKMSNYCGNCYYNKVKKVGEKACPFNSLYWNFYNQHEDKLGKNPRIGMMYNVWKKMQPEVREELLEQANYYLKNINDL